ncbi:MAG: Maf family protein, partial [Boseongicola sp.]|nr:Maf family protein [Boseongicola sp.]
LRNAGLEIDTVAARIDEDTIRSSLLAEGAKPRDVADALAEAKARKVAFKGGRSLVLGCDQVLEFDGRLISKSKTAEEALALLKEMRGNRHCLLSAAVIYEGEKPVWRHVGVARLIMRDASDAYLAAYVERNWESIRHSVGGYKLEEEGVRLMSRVDGDYFTVLGLPLVELLSYLTLRGTLPR